MAIGQSMIISYLSRSGVPAIFYPIDIFVFINNKYQIENEIEFLLGQL